MANVQLARRYARALFQLAQEEHRLDVVQNDLVAVAKLLDESPEFAGLSRPYVMSIDHRAQLYRAALEGRVDPLVLRFLLFLAEKGRAHYLAAIIEAFAAMYNDSQNILVVRIVSARPLETSQVEEISRRLQSRFKKTIRATTEVNASLLGGFLVRVGDTVYDYSINHQLDLFHRKLVSA